MADYYNVTTNLGDVEVANAITNGTKINITHIAFGDGGGSVPTPNKSRTTLVREVHRQAVTKYERHPTNQNWIVIETIIPSNVGGFTIREMGIIGNGKLISHGSHAPYEKLADLSGVSEYRLRFTQNITDGNVVSITLDDSLIYATQAWTDENYVPRDEIVDDLTTDDAKKPVSAKQAKKLQDEKLDANKRGVASGVASLDENKKVPVAELPGATSAIAGIMKLVNDLTTGGADAALTAEAMKRLINMFGTGINHFRVPRKDDLNNPWIIQFGFVATVASNTNSTSLYNFSFPNNVVGVFGSASSFGNASVDSINLQLFDKNGFRYWVKQVGSTRTASDFFWWAIGY